MVEIKEHEIKTREDWLTHITQTFISRLFEESGYKLPARIRVSVGFPRGKRTLIGQCWSTIASKDKHFEIFVSPAIDKANEVTAILIHEACHAVVGLQERHNKVFKRCAVAVGLQGKMTSTHASEDLDMAIRTFIKSHMPAYPHASLNDMRSPEKKEGTRLLKASCPVCGYTVRITRKWANNGLPLCPVCNPPDLDADLATLTLAE